MKHELEMIIELMQELQGKMEHGEEDFSERLGRKKPEISMMKVEAGPEVEGEIEMGMDDEEMPESPEDKLKNRLMKLRA